MISKSIDELDELTTVASGDYTVIQRGEKFYKADVKSLGGGLFIANYTLTVAQLQALNTTPVEVIAAPGANKYIGLVSVHAFRNGTAFTATDPTLSLVYTGATQDLMASAAGFLTRAATSTVDVFTQTTGAGQQLTANTGIRAYLTNDVTTATGTVTLSMTYRILQFS